MRNHRTIIVLMASTVLLSRLWELFHYDYTLDFWAKFGLDLSRKYDLFLFVDFDQYLHWYAQYTNYLLSISILCYIIYLLVKNSSNRALVISSKVLLFFSIFRLISYWLFRGSIEFDIICTAIAGFLILIIPKWRLSY